MHARSGSSLLAAAVLLVGLTGCSDKGDDEPSSSPPSSPTSSDGASSATTSASAEPSASSSVAPATGQLVKLKSTATFRLPAGTGWGVYDDNPNAIAIDSDDIPAGADGFVKIQATEFPQLTDDLARMAQAARKNQQTTRKISLTVGENRTIAGVEGYVLEGRDAEARYYEWGGLDADNVLTVVRFTIPAGLDAEEWIEPVLASLQWQ